MRLTVLSGPMEMECAGHTKPLETPTAKHSTDPDPRCTLLFMCLSCIGVYMHVILSAQSLSLNSLPDVFPSFTWAAWWCYISPLPHCSLKTYSLQANARMLQWSWPTLAWPLRFRGISRPGLVRTADANSQQPIILHLFYIFLNLSRLLLKY